jgi:hypothetical protein
MKRIIPLTLILLSSCVYSYSQNSELNEEVLHYLWLAEEVLNKVEELSD